MTEKMVCPLCGKRAMQHRVKRVTYHYKGKSFKIDQPADWCSACSEGIINPKDDKAVCALINEIRSD